MIATERSGGGAISSRSHPDGGATASPYDRDKPAHSALGPVLVDARAGTPGARGTIGERSRRDGGRKPTVSGRLAFIPAYMPTTSLQAGD